MHRYPAGGTNTQCTYFTRIIVVGIQPDTGISFVASSLYYIVAACSDNGLFQCAQVEMDIGKKIIQIQYGIAYNLSRSMISDIPTAVNFIKGRIFLFQPYFI